MTAPATPGLLTTQPNSFVTKIYVKNSVLAMTLKLIPEFRENWKFENNSGKKQTSESRYILELLIIPDLTILSPDRPPYDLT